MGVYFAFVLGVGYALRRYVKTSTDYFLSGRSIPAWVAGLAFLSANLGAQEVIGMAASGAKYGMATSHFYWAGAVPAMVFLGVFMMPFYYGSQARSVPEYLKLRFDEKTRGLNAISFATMTVFSSGISMYAMGLLLNLLLGWDFDTSVWLSAAVVLIYILLGGLTSAIYNEVLQFFLIVFGFAPLVFLGLRDLGGWQGLTERLTHVATAQGFAPQAWSSTWSQMGDPTTNPMGVEWFGVAMGLGFVLSFGYWCTDFLVVQRAMAADSMSAARRTPLIAAVPKMDIYQAYINRGASDHHYLNMGRVATVFGIGLSVAAAYVANHFNNIMDMLQLLFAFVNAPLFATFLLGMFWKRATGHGAFAGLLSGTAAAALHHGLSLPRGSVPGIKGGWLALLHAYPSEMAQNFWTAIWAFTVCFLVTLAVSLITRPRAENELVGLVYSLTPRLREADQAWYTRPAVLGLGVLAATLLLNLLFW
ncbi:MAG: Na+/galactose cotransporter [Gammaproteobacteria bacterium]|nr:MAG: Na+/galactose cotransporter [Gammaproteobacteria bacterium]